MRLQLRKIMPVFFCIIIIIFIMIISAISNMRLWHHDTLPDFGDIQSQRAYEDITVSSVVSVYDGDTFIVNIDEWPMIIGNKISIRIAGVDTPEITDTRTNLKALAIIAKQYTEKKLVKAATVRLLNTRRDKYFRILADVEVDGEDLGQSLIKANLAKEYDGGEKSPWSYADYKRYKK